MEKGISHKDIKRALSTCKAECEEMGRLRARVAELEKINLAYVRQYGNAVLSSGEAR